MIDAALRFLSPVHVAVDGGVALDGDKLFVDHSRLDADIPGFLTPATLLVDTNSASSMVAHRLLGASWSAGGQHVTGAGSSGIAAALTSGVLAINGTPAVRGQLLAFDLDSVNPRLAAPVLGILGADLLRHFIVELDYAEARLRLHEPGKEPAALWDAPTLTLEEGLHVPVVRAQLSERTVRLILDTGSGAGLLLFGRRLRDELAPHAREHVAEIGLGGPTPIAIDRTQLTLGTWRWNDVRTHFALGAGGGVARLAAAGIDGIVGPAVLFGVGARLIFGSGRVAVHHVPAGDKRALENFAGLRVERRDGYCRVADIQPGSPAARHEIEVGDHIAKLDGRPVSDGNLLEIARAFMQVEGTRITLTLKRADHSMRTVEITLTRFD